jgi:hypothetical protein
MLVSYLIDERLSAVGAAFDGPLLFERIAVTTTGFSRSISPLVRRESVRCASEYSYKKKSYIISSKKNKFISNLSIMVSKKEEPSKRKNENNIYIYICPI